MLVPARAPPPVTEICEAVTTARRHDIRISSFTISLWLLPRRWAAPDVRDLVGSHLVQGRCHVLPRLRLRRIKSSSNPHRNTDALGKEIGCARWKIGGNLFVMYVVIGNFGVHSVRQIRLEGAYDILNFLDICTNTVLSSFFLLLFKEAGLSYRRECLW